MPRYNDLSPLIDILGYLENTGCTNGMPFFGSPLLARGPIGQAGPVPDPELTALLDREGGPDPDAMDAYATKQGIHHWSCTVSFYGGPQGNAGNWEFAKEKFSAIPGAKFDLHGAYKLPLTPEVQAKFNLPQFGIPSLQMFSIGARSATNPTPGEGHVWFSPIIPRTGEAIFEANRVFRQAAKELGLPIPPFSLPTCYWERPFIFLFGFPITHDIETNKKNRAAFKKLVAMAAEHGWGEYRTAPAYQATVMNTYCLQQPRAVAIPRDAEGRGRPERDSLRGRYGIWPKHLREDAKA